MRFTLNTGSVVLMLAMLLPGAAQAQGTSLSKVAIASPDRIFKEIQETKDLNAKLSSELKNVDAQRLQRQAEITDLQAQRDTLRPDSQQYQDLNRQLMQKTIEFRVWAETTQATMNNYLKVQTQMLFDKITAAVASVASRRGVELVVADHRPDFEFDKVDVNQLKALLAQRNVLYNAELADLSNEVITFMDAEYKAGR